MLNQEAIGHEMAPKNGNFGFNISECKALLPAGTVDSTVKRVYEELPEWEETVADAMSRYAQIFKALADKFPSDNLLLVTHAQGVAVSAFLKDITVYEVEYCAYAHLRRPIIFGKKQPLNAGEFEVVSRTGQTGIGYYPSKTATDDTMNQPNNI